MREVTVNQVTEGWIINMLVLQQNKSRSRLSVLWKPTTTTKWNVVGLSWTSPDYRTFITGRYISKKGQPHPLQIEFKQSQTLRSLRVFSHLCFFIHLNQTLLCFPPLVWFCLDRCDNSIWACMSKLCRSSFMVWKFWTWCNRTCKWTYTVEQDGSHDLPPVLSLQSEKNATTSFLHISNHSRYASTNETLPHPIKLSCWNWNLLPPMASSHFSSFVASIFHLSHL